jgi:hypothetical protein
MIFLYTLRFDLKEQEAKRLEVFFNREEIKAAKEENEEKIKEIELDLISDTKEYRDELDRETEELSSPEDETIKP